MNKLVLAGMKLEEEELFLLNCDLNAFLYLPYSKEAFFDFTLIRPLP